MTTSSDQGIVNLVRHRVVRIVLDTGLLLGFVAEFATREGPDYDLHSWIGIVLIPMVSVHLAANWHWVTSAARRRMSHPEWPLARFNAAFSAITTICIASGFPLWFGWTDNSGLVGAHTLTGFASVLLAFSHLWRNRRRLLALVRRRAVAAN